MELFLLLPFPGSLQLPTIKQVVKLFFFFKEQEGLKNSHVSQDSISERVAVHVVKYWQMAGFNTSSEDDQNTHYRQLGGYTKKSKDIAFLNDQRGQRKMVIGERDASFEARYDAYENKKVVK